MASWLNISTLEQCTFFCSYMIDHRHPCDCLTKVDVLPGIYICEAPPLSIFSLFLLHSYKCEGFGKNVENQKQLVYLPPAY
jgi:hypothetical protein